MPNLSLEQLTSQLDSINSGYQREVAGVCGPYLRDKFTIEMRNAISEDKQPTWLSDELAAAALTASPAETFLRLDGLKVVRVLSPKESRDVDELQSGLKGTLFDLIDGLVVRYVTELRSLGVRRVQMPSIFVKREAFMVELFLYGMACVDDKP